MNLVLPLITLPYVLRILGTSNYGIIVLAASVVTYFHSITDYSFQITATRDVSTSRNSNKKLSHIYSRVMTIKSLILCLSLIVLTISVLLYKPFFDERLTFFLTFPMLIGHVLFPEWFFQGMEKMKFITILNVGFKVFFTIGVFIFINEKSDYWVYPLLLSAGYIGAGICGQYILLKHYKLSFKLISFRITKSTLKSNFAIFVNQFLPNLYNNTTTVLLGILVGTSAVGIYDAVKKIVDLGAKVINILSRTFYPFLNRKRNAFGQYKKLMLSVGIALTVGPLIFSHVVFWYLDINDEDSYLVLAILSSGIFFITLYDIFGINYFIIRRKDRIVMSNTILASLCGFALAFPLIHFFGIIGAAINLTFARFLMGAGLSLRYFTVQRKSKEVLGN